MTAPRDRRERRVTGRTVLVCFVAFFAVVAAVNAIMVRAAISTFAGTETDSVYKAGLAYGSEERAALAQERLNWTVEGQLARDAAGEASLSIAVKDAQQQPVRGIVVSARLAHPLDARLDHAITLARQPDGRFRGATPAAAGQWRLTIDISRDEQRVYRTVSRVVLK
jgi:nitrogen fixation protein FixH